MYRLVPRSPLLVLLCLGVAGCWSFGDMAVHRASNEFSCQPEKVQIIERADISAGLFDVEACGHRARYICFVAEHAHRRCVREPDPPQWAPDPKDTARLPRHPGALEFYQSTPAHARRICRDGRDPWRCLIWSAPPR